MAKATGGSPEWEEKPHTHVGPVLDAEGNDPFAILHAAVGEVPAKVIEALRQWAQGLPTYQPPPPQQPAEGTRQKDRAPRQAARSRAPQSPDVLRSVAQVASALGGPFAALATGLSRFLLLEKALTGLGEALSPKAPASAPAAAPEAPRPPAAAPESPAPPAATPHPSGLSDAHRADLRKQFGAEQAAEIERRLAAGQGQVTAPSAPQPPAEPPAEPGQPPGPGGDVVRFYHGGAEYEGGPRWLTQYEDYARGYAEKHEGSFVHYVDIPKTHPILEGKEAYDASGTGQEAPYVNFEAPEEIARQLRRLAAAPQPPPAAPDEGKLYPEYHELRNRADRGDRPLSAPDTLRLEELEGLLGLGRPAAPGAEAATAEGRLTEAVEALTGAVGRLEAAEGRRRAEPRPGAEAPRSEGGAGVPPLGDLARSAGAPDKAVKTADDIDRALAVARTIGRVLTVAAEVL